MNHKPENDFATWAVIEAQGKQSLKEVERQAAQNRENICGTLAEEPTNPFDNGFANFLLKVQKGDFEEKEPNNK